MNSKLKLTVPLLLVLMFLIFTSCSKDDSQNPDAPEIRAAKKDVIATHEHMGVCYGPYHKNGQAPGTSIPDSQIENDIKIIAEHFDYFRTYTVADNMDKVVEVAAKEGLQVALGVHCYTNAQGGATKTKADIDKAVAAAKEYSSTVVCIIVGNETNLGKGSNLNYVDPTIVAGYMDYAKMKIDEAGISLPVTSCLSAGGADANSPEYAPAILEKCRDLNAKDHRIIMMNIYPYYGQVYNYINNNMPVTPGDISGNMNWSFNNQGIKAAELKYGLAVVIGEIGWPSGGTFEFQNVSNAELNFKTTLDWINGNNSDHQAYNTFWFEMFDEPWKTDEPHGAGPNWGLYKSNQQTPKFNIPALR